MKEWLFDVDGSPSNAEQAEQPAVATGINISWSASGIREIKLTIATDDDSHECALPIGRSRMNELV